MILKNKSLINSLCNLPDVLTIVDIKEMRTRDDYYIYEVLRVFVNYESRNRDLKTRPIYECRCDERLKPNSKKSTRLTYTGLLGELEQRKIKTRLINEKFPSVMGEYPGGRFLDTFPETDLLVVTHNRNMRMRSLLL